MTAVEKAIKIRRRKREDGAKQTAGSWDAEIEKQIAQMKADGRSKAYTRELEYRLKKCARGAEAVDAERPLTMTPAQAKKWQADLMARIGASKDALSQQTARAYADAMHRFFRVLVKVGRLNASPFEGVTLPRGRKTVRRRFLTRDEAAALFKAAGEDWPSRFILFCALHAGMRREEVVEARSHWFDPTSKLINILRSEDWQPKDRDERPVPMTDAFASFLRERKMPDPRTYMLAPEMTARKKGYRYDFRPIWEALRSAAKVDCTFHDLRRTFASQLVSAGVSVFKVARWLGDDVRVVERHYGHLVAQDEDVNRAWG